MPFKISGMKPGRFRAEVEKRITALNEQPRLPGDGQFRCRAGRIMCPFRSSPPRTVVNRISVCPISESINGWALAGVGGYQGLSSRSGDRGGVRGSRGCRYWTAPAAIAREGPGCHRRPQSVASWGLGRAEVPDEPSIAADARATPQPL